MNGNALRAPERAIDRGEPLVAGHRLLTIVAVEPESELVTSFWLASPEGAVLPAPAAGQFLPIAVDAPGHGVLLRNYTISGHEAGRYRLSIKRECLPGQPPGLVSARVHEHWAVGEQVSAGAPQGHFVLDTTSRRTIVLIAGGIGITPLLAMLRDLAARKPDRRVVLIMGMRHRRDNAFQRELIGLARRMPNLSVHVRYSAPLEDAPAGPWPAGAGRVDEALLRTVVPALDADVYLCGPGPFMDAMDQALAAIGVPDERVRFEAFGPATIERRRTRAAATGSSVQPLVRFVNSDMTVPFGPNALNLLEFAEDLGLDPPFSCRSGSCGACATRRLSGAIRYEREPTVVVAEDEVLLCCALPAGHVSLDL